MAVPTSGSLSLRNIARERRVQTVGIDSYSSGTIPPGPYSLYDLMVGGNANGSGFDYCPPMDNVYPNPPLPDYRGPYDPALALGGIGPSNTPMGMSEFRGHQGNRELGCMKVNFNTACYPTGASSVTASAAGQSIRYEFDLNYTPKGSGAIIYMEINQTWAGLSTTSDTTGGTGTQLNSFTATYGSTIRYLNIATNSTTSTRTLTLSVYISGSCYATENLLHTITVTQEAGSGGGGGGPIKPGGGTQ